jgi:hypothetical protein
VSPAALRVRVYHRERADGVDGRLLGFLDSWAKTGPFAIVVPEFGGLRTLAQQQELYARGRTKPGRIVTNAKSVADAPHGRGAAIDVAPFRKDAKSGLYAPYYEDVGAFHTIGAFAEAMGLEWGGRWRTDTFPDGDQPHIQVPNWRLLPIPKA